MDRNTIKDKLKQIIADELCIDIVDDATAFNIDSLDCVNLIIATEEAFSLEIPDEDIANFHKLDDLVDYLASKVK